LNMCCSSLVSNTLCLCLDVDSHHSDVWMSLRCLNVPHSDVSKPLMSHFDVVRYLNVSHVISMSRTSHIEMLRLLRDICHDVLTCLSLEMWERCDVMWCKRDICRDAMSWRVSLLECERDVMRCDVRETSVAMSWRVSLFRCLNDVYWDISLRHAIQERDTWGLNGETFRRRDIETSHYIATRHVTSSQGET